MLLNYLDLSSVVGKKDLKIIVVKQEESSFLLHEKCPRLSKPDNGLPTRSYSHPFVAMCDFGITSSAGHIIQPSSHLQLT